MAVTAPRASPGPAPRTPMTLLQCPAGGTGATEISLGIYSRTLTHSFPRCSYFFVRSFPSSEARLGPFRRQKSADMAQAILPGCPGMAGSAPPLSLTQSVPSAGLIGGPSPDPHPWALAPVSPAENRLHHCAQTKAQTKWLVPLSHDLRNERGCTRCVPRRRNKENLNPTNPIFREPRKQI